MGKRFSRLEAALKYIRTGQGVTAVDAPAGSALREYQDWKAGRRVINYTRDPNSNPDKILQVSINPFGYAVDAANLAICPFSQRARNSSVGTALIGAANVTIGTPAGAQDLKGFIPAKATIFAGTGSTGGTEEPSEITGLRYKKKPGASYTVPYGAAPGKIQESEVRKDIRTAIAGVANATVSFKSERL